MVSSVSQVVKETDSLSKRELQILLLVLASEQCHGLSLVAGALRKVEKRMTALSSEIGASDVGMFCYSTPVV